MRKLALVLMLCALAACDTGMAAQNDAPSAAPPPLMGAFRPNSDTARLRTGGVDIQRGGLLFDNGVTLYTRTLDPRRGEDVALHGRDSFAALAVRGSDVRVELRRVTVQTVRGDGRSLCDNGEPQYVALAYDQRETEVTVLVFGGAEPPGPEATKSWLCTVMGFAAPDGARTRQGVVLWR